MKLFIIALMILVVLGVGVKYSIDHFVKSEKCLNPKCQKGTVYSILDRAKGRACKWCHGTSEMTKVEIKKWYEEHKTQAQPQPNQ